MTVKAASVRTAVPAKPVAAAPKPAPKGKAVAPARTAPTTGFDAGGGANVPNLSWKASDAAGSARMLNMATQLGVAGKPDPVQKMWMKETEKALGAAEKLVGKLAKTNLSASEKAELRRGAAAVKAAVASMDAIRPEFVAVGSTGHTQSSRPKMVAPPSGGLDAAAKALMNQANASKTSVATYFKTDGAFMVARPGQSLKDVRDSVNNYKAPYRTRLAALSAQFDQLISG